MTEYHCLPPRHRMASRDFRAHMLILEGKSQKRAEEAEKAERDVRRTG